MVVQPNTVAEDFGGKAMVFIALRGGWRGHAWLPLRLPVQVDHLICIRGVIVLHAQLSPTPYARFGHPVPREPPLPWVPMCQQGREAGLGPLAFPSRLSQDRQATRPHRSNPSAQRASGCLAWPREAPIPRHPEGGEAPKPIPN